MGSLRDVSIGDILTALGRYRPVALTVGAILVALLILPKPEGLVSTAAGGGTIKTPIDSTVAAGTSPAPGADATVDTTAADTSGSTTFSPSSTTFSSGSGSFSSDATTPTTAFDFGASDTTYDTTLPSSSVASTDTSGPLQIVSKAWASRTSGTPIAANGVPSGTLPVGVRVQDDKLSFVRLAGDELVLHLVEEPSGNRANEGTVSVQACPITTADWKDAEAIAIGDIAYDTGNCAQGVRGENGVWAFDLGKFAVRAGGNGFALVPGEDAGLDYQVCFKVS